MNDRNDQDLLDFAKQHLDESAETLPRGTASRLRTARYEALHHPPKSALSWGWPAWGLGTTCLVILSLSLWWNGPTNDDLIPAVEDLDLLASAEPFDLYEELDFYDWLAEHEHPS